MSDSRTKIGVIGCGNISGAYFGTNQNFNFFDIVACADLDVRRAQAKADEYSIAKAYSVDELLNDPEVEMVINLTIPQAHGPIMLQALEAGKSVYNEKPFTVTREEAQKARAVAKEKGLRVGSAPDTFLGGGIQPAASSLMTAPLVSPSPPMPFMLCRGHEAGIPARSSTISRAAARCSIWDRIISRRW
jgi:predicted dehydrogenase